MKARKKRRRAPITKVKRAIEIRNMIKATKIVEQVFRKMDSPFGRSEEDVAKEVRHRIRKQGASLSFKPIIASGRNASFVHHKPGRKIVRESELVIFDIGANYRGCCSDVTRMHVPSGKGGRRAESIYRYALAIQKAVIKGVRPGATLRDLHDTYAKMMKRRGYKVKHLIGHGLGSKVHERVKGKLEPGMVITVEPGIYLKNFGGCRVEDMILVTKGGPRVLSGSIPMLV
jgi:Xaa-Pro aminopeptidase